MTIEYIAGFIDGEGSIIINERRKIVRITIPQTNKEVLEKIKNFFGVGGVCNITKRKKHWKDAWLYYSGSDKASFIILNKLKGFLQLPDKIEKLERALKILEQKKSLEYIRIEKNKEAVKLVQSGLSYRQVQKITGVNRQTICNEIKKVRGSA